MSTAVLDAKARGRISRDRAASSIISCRIRSCLRKAPSPRLLEQDRKRPRRRAPQILERQKSSKGKFKAGSKSNCSQDQWRREFILLPPFFCVPAWVHAFGYESDTSWSQRVKQSATAQGRAGNCFPLSRLAISALLFRLHFKGQRQQFVEGNDALSILDGENDRRIRQNELEEHLKAGSAGRA